MGFSISKDGSISFEFAGISLIGGYPAVDGRAVRPLRVSVEGDEAVYELVDGTITLKISEEAGKVTLRMKTGGLFGSHDVSPVSGLLIHGADRVFHQGLGLGGPSGFLSFPVTEKYTSDAVFAAGNDIAAVTVHVEDQTHFRSYFAGEGDSISMVFDTEGTLSSDTEFPEVFLHSGPDFSTALHEAAEGIALKMHARSTKTPAFHWCSWYYLYHNLDQPLLEKYLKGFREYYDEAPFKYIQIDAGYFPSCGDWLLPNARFPEGLKHAADTIKAAGYEPGIWIGPFMVGEESELYQNHPDWVLKDLEGRPLSNWHQYNEPKVWGYRDAEYYILDTSNPEAMNYIVNVFKALKKWGFSLYKTDFLMWGLQDSQKVLRHTPGKTSFEYFRELMANIRAAIGGDSAWLGCISPFMPALGFVDMMRIGGDVGAQWNENSFGPKNMIREISGDQYFNGLYWQNDPDSVLLRDFHIFLEPKEVEALAIFQAVSGGVITTSDPVHLLGEDRHRLLKLIRPSEKMPEVRFPLWQEDTKYTLVTAKADGGTLVYYLNPGNDDLTEEIPWKKLLPPEEKYVRSLHGEASKIISEVPVVRIPAHGCALFFASPEPLEKEPENLWQWS